MATIPGTHGIKTMSPNLIEFSAGDYVKFGFPMASAMTVLSWGGVVFRSGLNPIKQSC